MTLIGSAASVDRDKIVLYALNVCSWQKLDYWTHLSAFGEPSMLHLLRGMVLVMAFALNREFAFAEVDSNSTTYIIPGCRALLETDPPKDMNSKFLSAQCRAIIRGLVYASSSNICRPKIEDTHEDIRVVVKYIDDQPARLHEPFFAFALEALQAAWPCK